MNKKRHNRIMAPPKRRTRGYAEKERISQPRYSRPPDLKHRNVPRRVENYQPIDVPDLVCRLLSIDNYKQERGKKSDWGGRGGARFQGKMRKYENLREPSCDTSSLHESSESVDESEYTKSGATSQQNLTRVMDAANSSEPSGSGNTSLSNVSVEPITLAKSIDNTRALLKKKSLVQIINNYIKAGIDEGKRQAKKYIRKALSFGVRSGYLIPTDPKGQVIRVSPTLLECRRSDAESRRRRRRARQGEDEAPFVDPKDRRPGARPWKATKRKTRRETSQEPVPPPKRRKNAASMNPGATLNLTAANQRKKGTNAGRRKERKKPTRTTKIKGKVMHANASAPSNKNEETVKRGRRGQSKHKAESMERKQSSRDRKAKSPPVDREDKEPTRKNLQRLSDEDGDSSKSSENEANQTVVTERRKSVSSQESAPRDDAELPGNPEREIEEILEIPDNNETQDCPIGNMD